MFLTNHRRAIVYAFDADCHPSTFRCVPVWKAQAGPPFRYRAPGVFGFMESSLYQPVVAGGVVYVIGTTHDLYAFDSQTGTPLGVGLTGWDLPGGTWHNAPVVVGDHVFVEAGPTLFAFPTFLAGCVRCAPDWTVTDRQAFTMGQPVVAGPYLVVPTAHDDVLGEIVATDLGESAPADEDPTACARHCVAGRISVTGDLTGGAAYPVAAGDRWGVFMAARGGALATAGLPAAWCAGGGCVRDSPPWSPSSPRVCPTATPHS